MNYTSIENDIVARLAPLVTAGYQVEAMPDRESDNIGVGHKGRVTVQVTMAKYGEHRSTPPAVVQEEDVYVDIILRARTLRALGGIYDLSELCRGLLIGFAPDNCRLPLSGIDFGSIAPAEYEGSVHMYSLRLKTQTISVGGPDVDVTPLITEITFDDQTTSGHAPSVELYASAYNVLTSGTQVILAWVTSGAGELFLSGVGIVEPIGTATVTITADITYTLSLTNGLTVTSDTVDIEIGFGDADYQLFNTEGTLLENGSIPSNEVSGITAPDATILRDGVQFGTVASGDSIDVPSAGSDLVIMGDLIETLYPTSPIDFNFTVNGVPQSVGYDVGTQTIQASAPDATILINGTQFADAPSGGALNVPVVNGGDNPVGSIAAGEVVIANNATFINATQVTDQEAEVDANIFVTLDGAQSGSWNAGTQTWEVTSSTITVSVAISDSTPEFDAVVTVTATATGATSYTFYLPSYDGKMHPVTQASNVYLWTVREVGNWTVRVSATDGASTGYGTTSGATVGDVHASAFIAAHNALSGATMNATYQTYVLGWFLRAKGIYTTHAVDAFTPEIAAGSEVYLYIPVNATTFSIPAFFINAFNPSEVATPVGFVGADASVNGLTGGVGKHALFNRAPSHFGQNNIGIDVYARAFVTSAISMGSAVGADGFSSVASAIGHVNSRIRHQGNDAANLVAVGADVTGLISLNRNAASFRFGELDGEPNMAYATDAVYGYNVTSATPSTLPYMGHACNGSAGAHRHATSSLCFLAVRSVMDDARRHTWAEAAIWLQTQFGRNV